MKPLAIGLSVAALLTCADGSTPGTTPPDDFVLPDQAAMAATYDGRLRAPSDLQVTRFATVGDARALAVGPDGSVYVSRPGSNQIVRLTDVNNDGVAETHTLSLSGLNQPHGMAFANGFMYVANTGAVIRYALDANQLPAGAPTTIGTYSSGGGHWTRTVLIGADGGVYVSVGSSCNICEERDDDRAAVVRFNAAGGGGRVFARGLRNAVGMALHPTTGKIWVSQNERDNIRPNHENLPPEEINILEDGVHYGWPYCHSDRVPNPEYGDAGRCATTRGPALPMQAHSAPLGISFLDRATRLPAMYRGDLLVAFHGSWNRSTPTGAKVVRVKVDNGLPTAYGDFIVGWQRNDGSRWGRPVDVVVAGDGAVLISDDQGDAIWRVTAK